MKEPTTIGERIVAACIAHQLGISMDRALKIYARGSDIDPSWETIGEELLKKPRSSASGMAAPNASPAAGKVRPA
jgi:hypothetical protein